MRNLLALAAMAVLVFAVIGWWLGWYKITSTPDTAGHQHISIDVDKDKISKDIKKSEDKLRDILTSNRNAPEHQQVTPHAEPPAPPSPGTTPDNGLVLPGSTGVVPADYTPRKEPPPE